MSPNSLKTLKVGFATTNPYKLKEAQTFFKLTMPSVEVVSVAPLAEVEETGSTFYENALLKLNSILNDLKQMPAYELDWVFSEDAGLSIPCLDGYLDLSPFPGVRSDRWLNGPEIQQSLLGSVIAAESLTYAHKVQALLHLLEGQENRLAYYETHLACYHFQTQQSHHFEGKLSLTLAEAAYGENGFGYDPIALVNGRCIAAMSQGEKSVLSHRAAALKAFSSIF
jgi:non-canonical purine NTP pyrophosphatase (RdgB/HAM1 family)